MTTIIRSNNNNIKLLISILFTFAALQTAYAGGEENNKRNTIIITADGIAKVVDSNGEISFSPVDRNIEKDEIKFGAGVTDVTIFRVDNLTLIQTRHRGGKVCINENLKSESRYLFLHPYDDENDHNYCLVELK